MDMRETLELYVVIAQIAATFAGFGSLASGLGQRLGGDDARVDAARLALMLFASLSATIFGLLPRILIVLVADPQFVLRLCAALAALAMLLYSPHALRRTIKNRSVFGFSLPVAIANGLCSLVAIASFGACALGIPAGTAAQTYLSGLVGALGSTIVMFGRVITSMLRPHSEGGPT